MAFNLFDSILNQFTGQAQQKVPSFGTPQAPRTTNYVAPNVSISTTPKVSQWVRNGGFAPWYEWTVDTSQNFLNRLLTPVEQVGTSLFKNQVQGGQQLSDIAMQHSESAIDRGYNQGYIDLWQKIKSKHPQYADISDEELGRKIVAKYPQYQDIVDAGSGIMSNPISWSLASVESGLSKWIWTMFQGISNLWSAPLQESGTAGVTRFTKGALETGLWSAQLATSIMPTTLWAKALVAPTVNTLFSTDTAWKVLQPVTQWIETGIWMWQEALGFNPESSVSKDIQNIGSTAWNLALFAGAQKGWAKIYDWAKPIVTKVGQKISNIPNPVTGAKNVITREIPVGIMERDLSLTPTERASIETINWKPAGAVALEYNLPKDKQAMADTLSVKADEAYNGITKDLKNIPTRTESAPAKEMLGIMLDEMGSSPILVRTMKPYMEKLQSMLEQPDYSLAEKNAIRRDFDRIVANKIFDSKWRVSGIEDKAIANIREWLSTELQNEAMQYGIDIKWKNNILRTSIALRDWVLRRLSQENKNNKIGLQDIWVGAIFWAGDPLTTASVIFGKKVLENSAPWIAQRLYNSNKTPYATSNLKRGVTISPRDTTNGLSIAPDNVPPVRIPVKKPIVKPNTIKNESTAKSKKLNTNASDTIPEGYFKNAFWEIQKNPSNKKWGFIKIPEIGKKTPVKNPLVEEARKYKSAEEFVMAQWEPVYHWSKNKFEQFDSKFTKTSSNRADKWVWTYFTDNKKIAQEYAKDNWYLYTTFVNKEKSKILNWDEPLKSQKDKSVIKWIVEKYLEPNKNRYPEKWLIIDIEKSLNNKEPFWIIYEYLTSVIDEKELSKILNSKWIDWIISKDYWMWWNVYTLFDANKIKTESQLKQIYEQSKSIVKNPLVEEARNYTDKYEFAKKNRLYDKHGQKLQIKLWKTLSTNNDWNIYLYHFTPEKNFDSIINKWLKWSNVDNWFVFFTTDTKWYNVRPWVKWKVVTAEVSPKDIIIDDYVNWELHLRVKDSDIKNTYKDVKKNNYLEDLWEKASTK